MLYIYVIYTNYIYILFIHIIYILYIYVIIMSFVMTKECLEKENLLLLTSRTCRFIFYVEISSLWKEIVNNAIFRFLLYFTSARDSH